MNLIKDNQGKEAKAASIATDSIVQFLRIQVPLATEI